MILDVIRRILNMRSIKKALVLPMATGMTITLTLLALKKKLMPEAKYAIWPRMDQKTCLKAIVSAGFTPIIIENVINGETVQCDVEIIQRTIESLPIGSVGVVLATTSCFAPRVSDDVEAISKICREKSIAFVINNAYGLQCNKCVAAVEQACRAGRVDAIIQSTDKNFLVPVGGAIITSPNGEFVDFISKTYPGRASMSPLLDLFITLLSMGKVGYEHLRNQRIGLAAGPYKEMLVRVAKQNGTRLLQSPKNTISFAMALADEATDGLNDGIDPSEFGSMLFTRGVSGARVVQKDFADTVEGFKFNGYGSSVSDYPTSYFALACAIGIESGDIPKLEQRLNETFRAWRNRVANKTKKNEQIVDKVSES